MKIDKLLCQWTGEFRTENLVTLGLQNDMLVLAFSIETVLCDRSVLSSKSKTNDHKHSYILEAERTKQEIRSLQNVTSFALRPLTTL